MKPFVHADAAAAQRFLTLHDPDASGEDIDRAMAWIEASTANADAFDRVERFWRESGALPQSVQEHLAQSASRRRNPLTNLRTLAAAATLLLGFVGLSALLMPMWSSSGDRRTAMLRYQSAIGQTREVQLPDGSTVTLGGASAVSVAFDTRHRNVTLTDGQALFKVAKDSSRPFIVRTGSGYTRAVGTVFEVHRTQSETTVMVAEGTVLVGARDRQGRARSVRLPAGNQVRYFVDGRVGSTTPVEPARVGNWRSGKLTFVDRPLGQVIADLNRYSPRPIIIENAEIERIGVTGVVRINRFEDWLDGLASISNVAISSDSSSEVIRLSLAPGKRHVKEMPR